MERALQNIALVLSVNLHETFLLSKNDFLDTDIESTG